MRQTQVFLDDCFDVAWRNRVQIEDIRNLDLYRIWERIVEIFIVHKFEHARRQDYKIYKINGKLARFKSYI